MLGEGGFAKVFQVRYIKTGQVFAMKVVKKRHVLDCDVLENMKSELDVLKAASHFPFCVTLRFAFQSRNKLYLVMDYMQGGDLFQYLQLNGCLAEDQAAFYAAELVLAISHLHEVTMVSQYIHSPRVSVSVVCVCVCVCVCVGWLVGCFDL